MEKHDFFHVSLVRQKLYSFSTTSLFSILKRTGIVIAIYEPYLYLCFATSLLAFIDCSHIIYLLFLSLFFYRR